MVLRADAAVRAGCTWGAGSGTIFELSTGADAGGSCAVSHATGSAWACGLIDECILHASTHAAAKATVNATARVRLGDSTGPGLRRTATAFEGCCALIGTAARSLCAFTCAFAVLSRAMHAT